jgi:hypothetical protein
MSMDYSTGGCYVLNVAHCSQCSSNIGRWLLNGQHITNECEFFFFEHNSEIILNLHLPTCCTTVACAVHLFLVTFTMIQSVIPSLTWLSGAKLWIVKQ